MVPTAVGRGVRLLGAVPVPVDVDPATALTTSRPARAAVTARHEGRRAGAPLRAAGAPAALAQLGLPIVEDVAQADGAVGPAHGRPSVTTAYSFYPTKNLGGVGDGGGL